MTQRAKVCSAITRSVCTGCLSDRPPAGYSRLDKRLAREEVSVEHTNSLVRARSFVIVAASLGLMLLSMSVAQAGTSLPTVVTKHVMWGAGQGHPSTSQASANNLIYQ